MLLQPSIQSKLGPKAKKMAENDPFSGIKKASEAIGTGGISY
jgi:hypothetical protein